MFSNRALSMIGFTVLFLVFSAAGCGGGGGGVADSDPANGITDIGQLPRATAKVVASSQTSAAASFVSTGPLAAAGMSFGQPPAFQPGDSLAACEMYNQTRQNIGSAAEGDLILCFIQEMAGQFSNSLQDGNFHAFGLNFPQGGDGGGAPDHVRFRIERAGGRIGAFEMYACRKGSQMFYLRQTISGNDFSMLSKGVENAQQRDDGQGFAHETQVSGLLNERGQFVGSKFMSSRFSHESSQFNGWGVVEFEQRSDGADLSGSMNFSGSDGNGSFSNASQIAASVQLLDFNPLSSADYDVGLLALGDGAVKGAYSYTDWNGNPQAHFFTEGWNGDTRRQDPNAAANYLNNIDQRNLPLFPQPQIGFEGSEAYPCDAPEEGGIQFDPAVEQTCNSYGRMDDSWINCWDLMGNGNPSP